MFKFNGCPIIALVEVANNADYGATYIAMVRKGVEYVTCRFNENESEWFAGHYFKNYNEAMRDFIARAELNPLVER